MSDMPAAAPAASPLGDLFATTATGPATRSFSWSAKARPLDGVYGWLRIALIASICAQVLTALALIVLLPLFASLASGEGFSEAQAAVLGAFASSAQLLPLGAIAVTVVCVVCYSLFIHRAMKNLHVSNARGLSMSPGWAVGYSFVPLINLVMIYRVMKELWEASADPDRGRHPAPQVLGWWWGLYLAAGLIGQLSGMFSPSAADTVDPSDFYSAFVPIAIIGVIAVAATIASTLLLLVIIRQIKEAQDTLRATSAFEE